MHTDPELSRLAAEAGALLRAQGQTLVTAESCTGGWVGKALTEIPGSSAWYLGGVVSYSNALKSSLLGVQTETLAAHGAVSVQTVREMALGVLRRCGGTRSLAVTGIAGPDGGTTDKPVGLVWFGWAWSTPAGAQVEVASERFAGDRDAVRRAAVARALQGLIALTGHNG